MGALCYSLCPISDSALSGLYPLSLHDALPICFISVPRCARATGRMWASSRMFWSDRNMRELAHILRSEEHTSELQSRGHLVCRLLLEKKKNQDTGRSLSP